MSPRRRLPAGIRGRGSCSPTPGATPPEGSTPARPATPWSKAEAFKRRIDVQLALGDYRPVYTTTFATYAQNWVEVWPLKDQTPERYRGILRRELLPVFGPVPLAKIHPHAVRTWVAGQVAGPLSASSVRKHITVLRSCLKAAQIDGHLDTLPLLGVKMPRSHSRPPAVMTLREASR